MQPSLNDVKQWALHAGQMLKEGFGKPHQVHHKGVIDLVTEMDHLSEDYLIGQIRSQFPDHTIITEESGLLAGHADHCWYIDPLDGTVNYSHNIPIFTVSIAYTYKGELQLGVVYDPMVGECFTAERGRGAWLNDQRLHVSDKNDLINSLLVSGFPYDVQNAADNNLGHFSHFVLLTQGVRRLGSAALDLCYVAAGRFDGYWELGVKPWDIAAGVLMVEEAGGKATDINGEHNYFKHPYSLITANDVMHAKILEGLRA
jgi:myo-inositol-1(or 4)-monophosphatase